MENLNLGEGITKAKQSGSMNRGNVLDRKQSGALNCKTRRARVEALLTPEIINTTGLLIFSCEKQDLCHLLHGSG